ncbi:MAG: hypothetical protein RR295_08600, partial [Oscillospiraceae bacterium]
MTLNKRQKLIALIAAALCLVTVFCLIFVASKTKRGGRDTPYPYSYRQGSDGSVRFVIKDKSKDKDAEDAEEYRWAVKSASRDDIATVSEPEIDGKKTSFVLKGQGEGSVVLVLQHQSETPQAIPNFALELFVQVDALLETEVLDVKSLDLEPQKQETTAAGYLYQRTLDLAGGQVLHFYAPEAWQCNWETLDYDDKIVSVLPQVEEDGSYSVTISPLKLGETALRVRGRPQTTESQPGITFSCKLAITEAGAWELREETVLEEYIPLKSEEDVRLMQKGETWLGKPFTLPKAAHIRSYYETPLIGNVLSAGVRYTMKDKGEFGLFGMLGKNAAEMVALFPAEMSRKQVAVDGITMQSCFADGDSSIAFWDDADGVTWMLDGGTCSEETLHEMAKLVIQSQAAAKSAPAKPADKPTAPAKPADK